MINSRNLIYTNILDLTWKTRVNNNSDLKYIEIMHKRIFYTLALLRPQYDYTPEKWKKYNSLAKNYVDQFQITEAD